MISTHWPTDDKPGSHSAGNTEKHCSTRYNDGLASATSLETTSSDFADACWGDAKLDTFYQRHLWPRPTSEVAETPNAKVRTTLHGSETDERQLRVCQDHKAPEDLA